MICRIYVCGYIENKHVIYAWLGLLFHNDLNLKKGKKDKDEGTYPQRVSLLYVHLPPSLVFLHFRALLIHNGIVPFFHYFTSYFFFDSCVCK